MEKEKLSYRTHIVPGTSLKELMSQAINRHRNKPGPSFSERVRWLSVALESETFWKQLNSHLANDRQEKRHSVGGVFFREYGNEAIEQHTWHQLFSSLDSFLKKFDMRATEFIFRDFQPENPSINLARTIEATRELSIGKYPRLRRLYWDDYEKTLEKTSFWSRLASDLNRLPKSISAGKFFSTSKLTKERLNAKERQLEMKIALRQPLWTIHGPPGEKVGFIEYGNLDQITRGLLIEDPRTFLLNYQQKSKDKLLDATIKEAKTLLEQKILPARPKTEMTKLTKKEFNKLINDKEFWLLLSSDLENHFNSQNPTYSFSFFLRHYDETTNEINPGKVGTYAKLMTKDVREVKNLKKMTIKPSKRMVQYLMWEFTPSEDIQPAVTRVKELCAELFPQDCLYVRLQTPKFWKAFEADVNSMQGNHTLASFLRYFSEKNPNCDRRQHHRYESEYQVLLHRAYHKKKSFLSLLSSIGVKDVSDYKDGLAKLFLYMAPSQMREILLKKFPKDFDLILKTRQVESDKLFQRAKKILEEIKMSGQLQTLSFNDKNEALAFREKIWSATRSLKLNAITDLKDNILTVKIGKKVKYPPKTRVLFEAKVKELKSQGLKNNEIALQFGNDTKDHHIEYAVRKLVARGELKSGR